MRTRFRRRFPLIAILVASSGLVAAGSASQRGVGPSPLPGQPAATPAPGTGLVLGRVVEGDTDRPVANALVSVSMSGPSGTPGVPGAPPAAPAAAFAAVQLITGDDGVFVLRNVPRGTFSFRASAQGYLPTQGLDSRRPGGSGHPLSLEDGAKVNNVTLRMWKMGVIAGRLVDEAGEPFEGGQISALRIEPGEQRRVAPTGWGSTDDRGAFRVSNLAPGDYLVCALFARHIVPIAAGVALQQAQTGGSTAMMEINQSYQNSGAPPVSGSSGYRVGDHLLTSSAASRNLDPAPDAEGRLRVYGNACHGGADSVAGAIPVTLGPGEERTGVDMVTRLLPSLRVMGTVTGPRGPLAHVGVHLLPAGAEAGMSELMLKAASTVTDATGAFGFIGVPAGAYSVRVVLAPRVDPDPMMYEYQMMMEMGITMPARPPSTAPALPLDPTLHARLPISVSDTDVLGLSVQVREAARITGQLAYDGARARPTADQLQKMRVDMRAVGGPSPEYFATPRGVVDANGLLRTTGIVPGRYLLTLAGTPAGWFLKSIVVNGLDASAEAVDVGSSDISSAIITLTDRPVSMTGTVRGAGGGPDPQGTVIVFPADRARWSDLPASGRSSRSVRVSPTGAFTIGDLAAGQYLIVAIDDRHAVGWNDPKRLDAVSRVATPVSIGDAERRTIDIRTSPVR